jgi:protein-tyrosine phosphatase
MRKTLFSKTMFLTTFLTILLLCQTSLAVMASEGNEAILKVDRIDALQLPRNFRTTNDVIKPLKDGYMPSTVGLSEVHASASSIYSELEFTQVLAKIPSQKVIVVDLRQESHGYLDGMAVSWFAPHDWGNDGKTLEQVKPIERVLLDATVKNSPVTVYGFDDKTNKLCTPFQMTVHNARTEEEMVTAHGAGYFRLALPDHFRPDNANVDKFMEFYKSLPENAWLHFHCYAGMGRTTIFMVMYDILHNAKTVDYDDIVARQASIGIVDLRDIPVSKKNWSRWAYIDREQFTRHFYDYVKQSSPDFSMSWSQWAQEHHY